MILLVDDEVAICDLVAGILQSAGYEVRAAQTVKEAEAMWSRHGREVELLLTDIMLPDANGRALIRRLREDRSDLRVLQMTGYDPGRAADSEAPGRDPIITKPFTPDELIAAVRSVVGPPESPSPELTCQGRGQ